MPPKQVPVALRVEQMEVAPLVWRRRSACGGGGFEYRYDVATVGGIDW